MAFLAWMVLGLLAGFMADKVKGKRALHSIARSELSEESSAGWYSMVSEPTGQVA